MLSNIEHWRDAPKWDPESIQAATENWFAFLSEERSGRDD